MAELPVGEPLSTTIEEPEGSIGAVGEAVDEEALRDVARRFPDCLTAWAALGESALRDGRPVEAYAYFRVGYHRGLDRIRGAGWRGKGEVAWAHEGNRGFLRALKGLGEAAGAIGETEEAERCSSFFGDLAPDAPS